MNINDEGKNHRNKNNNGKDNKTEESFGGIWIFLTIIGLILSFTGVGAIIGIPMLGLMIIRLARGVRVFGCLTFILISFNIGLILLVV